MPLRNLLSAPVMSRPVPSSPSSCRIVRSCPPPASTSRVAQHKAESPTSAAAFAAGAHGLRSTDHLLLPLHRGLNARYGAPRDSRSAWLRGTSPRYGRACRAIKRREQQVRSLLQQPNASLALRHTHAHTPVLRDQLPGTGTMPGSAMRHLSPTTSHPQMELTPEHQEDHR